jgi:hypothetical protein
MLLDATRSHIRPLSVLAESCTMLDTTKDLCWVGAGLTCLAVPVLGPLPRYASLNCSSQSGSYSALRAGCGLRLPSQRRSGSFTRQATQLVRLQKSHWQHVPPSYIRLATHHDCR